MASSCAGWKLSETRSASWKRGYVGDYPRTVTWTVAPDLEGAPLNHPYHDVCASERRQHENTAPPVHWNYPTSYWLCWTYSAAYCRVCSKAPGTDAPHLHTPCHFHKKRILGLIWHLEAQCLIYSNLHIKIYKTGCVDKRSGTISSFLMNVDQQSSRPKLLVVSMRFQVAAEVLVWESLMLWSCTFLCLFLCVPGPLWLRGF